MSINTLKQVFEKKGEKYINNILDKDIIITEKLDVFRFSFEKKNNDIIFYKKDNTKISLIERTLSDIWEDALVELPILCENKNIPEGYRFGIAYTPIERPLRLPYTNIPKYILTDITIRNEEGKVTETLSYDELTYWSGELCIGRPPVIFKGKLSENQKEYLIKYGLSDYDNIEEDSMSEFISNNISTIYSKEQTIEGIIIEHAGGIMQIPSYEFDILNKAYENQYNIPRDYYDIFIMNLNSVLESYSFPVLESSTLEEKYIEIVNNIYKRFIKSYSNQYTNESIDIKYLNPPQYANIGKLNKKFIKDEETLETLNNDINESIYKIILSSLRKYKKEYGLLTESITQKFNTYVFLINNYIDNDYNNELINENLNETKSDNIAVKELSRRKINDIDNMRVIASIQSAFDPEAMKVNRGKEKCAIYITQLQPFTQKQYDNIMTIYEKYKIPVIIANVGIKGSIKGENFKLSDNLSTAILKSISQSNKEIIPAYTLMNTWDLYELYERCRPNFEPMIIITDKGKSAEIGIQLYFEEEVMGKRINVENDFNIGEMNIDDYLEAYRSIEDNDASKFMEFTPECIHPYFDLIENEYKIWSGAILVNS